MVAISLFLFANPAVAPRSDRTQTGSRSEGFIDRSHRAIQSNSEDRLSQMQEHLVAHLILEERCPTFDMCDGPEEEVLEPFAALHEALQWLDEKVTTPWRAYLN